MNAIIALWKRELIKFVQDRGRFGGALAQPLMLWLLLGLGFQGSFQLPNAAHLSGKDISFIEYLFPGMIVLVVLFTAIFSTVSIVEERHNGFLQAAIVAPIPRVWLVLGNIAGGATLGMAQALLFLLAAPFIGISLNVANIFAVLLICGMLGLAFGAIGFAMAWFVSSIRGFLALMNFFLIPLWMLSGAFFPVDGVPIAVRWLMYLNPVTHGLNAMREALYGFGTSPVPMLLGFVPSLLVLGAFMLVAIALSTMLVRKPIFG